MRLGQLARKLERTPAEIIEFLASKNVSIEEGVNSKLEESHITLVLQQYAPELRADIIALEPDPTVGLPAATSGPEIGVQEDDNLTPTPGIDPSQPEQNDVIRAPKVELAGLKVLGKIDLPEPKKKLPEAQEGAAQEQPKELRKEKRTPHHKKTKPAKNPVALQREQEALAAQRKRDEELRQLKERRTQNYLKRVKAHQPTKAARLIKEEAEQLSAAELKERPKTWWGRFVQWFTG
jgi:hypothetical protein